MAGHLEEKYRAEDPDVWGLSVITTDLHTHFGMGLSMSVILTFIVWLERFIVLIVS